MLCSVPLVCTMLSLKLILMLTLMYRLDSELTTDAEVSHNIQLILVIMAIVEMILIWLNLHFTKYKAKSQSVHGNSYEREYSL